MTEMQDIMDRLTALENATGALADAQRDIVVGVADWGSRMEDAEDSIGAFRLAIARIDETIAPPHNADLRRRDR